MLFLLKLISNGVDISISLIENVLARTKSVEKKYLIKLEIKNKYIVS